tara:strand:- start:526 stop:783 length:258 start_codon:yes stop_codon:yes gene_type:complete
MKFTNKAKKDFLFKKSNYKWLLISIITIGLGFLLMSGGGSKNPNIFNEEIFNFRRIRLAPSIILIGFGIAIYSILKTSQKNNGGT